MDIPISAILYVICCGVLIFGLVFSDYGLQIEFKRVLDAGTQTVTQIRVDNTKSTDQFQVMCKVNNVKELYIITTLKVQYKASANDQDFKDLAILQNIDENSADTYRKPIMAQGAGSGWTPVGSFDTTSNNGRDTTLGVSRAVSIVTCSNAGEYRCNLAYLKPESSNYESDTIDISKELDVQVLPTTITSQVFNISGFSTFPINLSDPIEPFYVGQTVRMECTADIGSYNGTAQISWLKSTIAAGSHLAPYYSSETVLGDPRATSNCVYQKTDSVTYNVTAQDAFRTADNRLYFQCYVYIPGSMNWETPEDQRQNFVFIVNSMGDSSDTEGVNKESMSKGTVTIEVFVGAVIGVVALVVVVIAIFAIYRRYRLPCRHTSDNTKHTKNQSNPVFVTQTASTYDNLISREQTEYTEIGMMAVGNSGSGGHHSKSTSYERLHASEKAVYTELGGAFPESKTQYVIQTDSPAAGSNEFPENQESSNEPRYYDNETNSKKTQASTYEHEYTAPLEHQYTALGAKS